MSRIDIEHRPSAASHWWPWLLPALLVLLMAAAAWYFLSDREQMTAVPDEPGVGGETTRPEATPGSGGAGPGKDRTTDEMERGRPSPGPLSE